MLDTSYRPIGGVVNLPGPGKYRIWALGSVVDTEFNIIDTGLFVFRFKEPDHGLVETGATDTPPLYSRCDSLLNGYQEYYYPNGALEMRGVFKQGFTQDSIALFYNNGKLKSRTTKSHKTVIVTDFDSLGNRLRFYTGENKSFMEYHDYEVIYFYPSGKIKRKESLTKNIKRIKVYYPDGSIKSYLSKTKKVEYFSNGQIHFIYKWRDRTEEKKDEWKTFAINRKEFDKNGMLLRATKYEEWGTIIYQPNIDVYHADWINRDEKYENGKRVFLIEDMDAKKYREKYPVFQDGTDEDDE
jgi:antitoxin component YwqK of YwqJK toxin-antitoxin module